MKYILLLVSIIFAPHVYGNDVDCDNRMSTYAMSICAGRDIKEAEVTLTEYLAKSKERYAEQIKILDLLDKSQMAWLTYRKMHCDTVNEMWIGGTIRGVMVGACMLELTKQRTHTIWKNYLTYMDSTLPILPEPK